MTLIDARSSLPADDVADGAGTPAPRRAPRKTSRSKSDEDGAVGSKQSRTTKTFLVVGLVLFALYSVAPIWWLVVSSTKSGADLYNSNGLWFSQFTLIQNLQQMANYQHGIFFRWLLNSLFYSTVGAAVCTILSIAAGYGLSRFVFRGQKFGLAAVIGSFLIPHSLLTLPLYLVFSHIGLLNTVWAVLIPSFISPFSVYLAKVYVDGAVPVELMEAARIDGAGEVRIFIQIVWRLMMTGGATIFLLSFVANWNSFFLPLIMLRGSDKWTLSLGLYSWLSTAADQTVDLTSLTITGALISILPLAIFMIAMQRFWKTGVTLGSLK
jgi:multiple sugar transport system permease protein